MHLLNKQPLSIERTVTKYLHKTHTVRNQDGLSKAKQIKKPLWRFVPLESNGRDDGWRKGGKSKVGGIQMGQREKLREKDRGKLFISVAGKKVTLSLSLNVKLFPGWLLKACIINT